MEESSIAAASVDALSALSALVYPDGVCYAQVRVEDVPEIVEEHIANGHVVERLALLKIPSEGA